jgi:hypothetical protein
MAAKTDMTTNEFKDFAMEGGVAVEEFLQKFIQIAEDDFPGALEKMAKTWEGVTQRMKSFVQVYLGLELLGPVTAKVTAALDQLLTKAAESEQLAYAVNQWGQALAAAFDIVYPAVQKVVIALADVISAFLGLGESVASIRPPIRGLHEDVAAVGREFDPVATGIRKVAVIIVGVGYLIADALNWLTNKIREWASGTHTTIGQLISNAVRWGTDFIRAFVDGITKGIEILVKVINIIAGIINDWFAPKSPPKIAPLIDQWGRQTMEEWLKGFTSADFDMFGDIAGLAEQFLRSIGSVLGETNIVPAILESRESIMAALRGVRSGMLSIEEAARRMSASVAHSGGVFEEYISLLLQYEYASKQIEDTQSEINEITSRYEKILNDLNAQLREVTEGYDERQKLAKIEEALATGLLTTEEQERLEMEKQAILLRQQIRETETQRDAELEAARAKLENLEAERKLIEEQLANAKAQIQIQIDTNRLIEEQSKLLERLAKSGEEATEELQHDFDDLFDTMQEGISRSFDFDLEGILEEARLWADQVEASLGDMTAPLTELTEEGGPLDLLTQSLGDLYDTMVSLTGKDSALDAISGALTTMSDALFAEGEGGKSKFDQALGVLTDISDTLLNVWNTVSPWLDTLSEMWSNFTGVLSDFGEAMGDIKDKVNSALILLGFDTIEGSFMGWFRQYLSSEFNNAINELGDVLEWIATKIDDFADVWSRRAVALGGIIKFFEALSDLGSSGLTGPGVGDITEGFSLGAMWEGIKTLFDEKSGEVLDVIVGMIGDIIAEFSGLDKELVGESIIPDMMDKIVDSISTGLGNAVTELQTQTGLMVTEFENLRLKVLSLTTVELLAFNSFLAITLSINIRNFTNTKLIPFVTAMSNAKEETNATYFSLSALKLQLVAIVQPMINARTQITLFNLVMSTLVTHLENAVEQAKALKAVIDSLHSKVITVTVIYRHVGTQPRQFGGPVEAGHPYIVGEKRPELFIPEVSGIILPRIPRFFEQMISRGVSPKYAASNVNAPFDDGIRGYLDQSIHIEMNPSYKNVELPTDIVHDIRSALVAARR